MILELKIVIIIAGYLFLMATSGIIIRFILSHAEKGKIAEKRNGILVLSLENVKTS